MHHPAPSRAKHALRSVREQGFVVTRQGASRAGLGYTATTYGLSPGGGFGELDGTESGTENAEQGIGEV